MNKNKVLIVVGSILSVLFIAYAIPLPFKPSLWADLQRVLINKQLAKSTESVQLPSSKDYNRIRFGIYAGWVNAYAVQIGDTNDLTKGAYYYQLSSNSKYPNSSESPGQIDLEALAKVQSGENCVASGSDFKICTIPLINKKISNINTTITERQFVRVDKTTCVLIAELTTNSSIDGYRIDSKGQYFNYKLRDRSEQEQIVGVLMSTKPVSLQEAKDLYFNPEF